MESAPSSGTISGPRVTAIPYRGRFAPSPTGPLHFGSLVAAVASFLEARRAGGAWLVRIEDLDREREIAGAADEILRTLERFGLHWDEPVLRQSSRLALYEEAFAALGRAGALYACGCSRSEIADSSVHGIEGPVYPGTCRAGLPAGRAARASRMRVTDTAIEFADSWQGPVRRRLETDYGDFVVRRADGFFAYQLAVVVDDAAQGITHVVRGADLIESTPRQIFLQQRLGLPTPAYAHHPVATDASGGKLSKQSAAAPVNPDDPGPALHRALAFLGQTPPGELAGGGLEGLWRWALDRWDPARVPAVRTVAVD